LGAALAVVFLVAGATGPQSSALHELREQEAADAALRQATDRWRRARPLPGGAEIPL